MTKQRLAHILLWFSLVLMLVGATITDPTAGFALITLAGLSSLGTIVLGAKRIKIFGLLLLVISIGMAIIIWPQAKNNMEKYQERVQNKNFKK